MLKDETMLKALLVDDEPFITKGLSVLVDWNALGFTVEGTASNGLAGAWPFSKSTLWI